MLKWLYMVVSIYISRRILSCPSKFVPRHKSWSSVILLDDLVSPPTMDYIDKPKAIFVLGGPGAGKGTQCTKLSQDFGMIHLSAGELLRRECASGSPNGLMIETYLRNGKIVPVEVTIALLGKEIQNVANNRYLIDGFPRNQDNVDGWNSKMKEICDVEAVVFIDCNENELQRRLLSRGITSGRSDDNLESAKKRIATYKSETLPIISHYEEIGLLKRVLGSQSIDDVYSDLLSKVSPLVVDDLVERTRVLVKALSQGDRATLQRLCDDDVSHVGFEYKVDLVKGIDRLAGLDILGSSVLTSPSKMEVALSGISADISIVTTGSTKAAGAGNKVEQPCLDVNWLLKGGRWTVTHLRRSDAARVS